MATPPNPRTCPPVAAPAGVWLGLETTGLRGSVAVARADPTGLSEVASRSLPITGRSAQTLAPTIIDLLGARDLKPADLAAIVVAAGPGSFTGLRVGVVTAKTLAYATGAALLAVDSLDALADAAAPPETADAKLWALLDAQRGELFAAPFAASGDRWQRDGENRRLTHEQAEAERQRGAWLIGPPVAKLVDDSLANAAEPNAESVLRVAWRRWRDDPTVTDPFQLTPAYHRPSAAEEKADSA